MSTSKPISKTPTKTLTRDEYLELRKKGMLRTQILNDYFPGNTSKFYRLLKKWGLKEIDAEERALDLMPPINQTGSEEPADDQAETVEMVQEETENEEGDDDLPTIELNCPPAASVMVEQLDEKHLAEIEQLKADRHALLQTIERAVDEGYDPVNHPAHYTAGKIECIDAIEAATTGLTGGVAYCTGAAIKYLWRWSRKNGVEDLKKARWYINRLIEELETGYTQTDA